MNTNKKNLIGEKVKVENESEIGVVTRIDFENNIIYVLFPKMKEKSYSYSDSINKNIIQPFIK